MQHGERRVDIALARADQAHVVQLAEGQATARVSHAVPAGDRLGLLFAHQLLDGQKQPRRVDDLLTRRFDDLTRLADPVRLGFRLGGRRVDRLEVLHHAVVA